MKNSNNIEQVFKETFEHFEAEVNPRVWSNVQNGINSVPGTASSAAAKFTIGKIMAGAVSVVLIGGSVWYFSSSNNGSKSPAPAITGQNSLIVTQDISQNNNSENTHISSLNTDGEKRTTSISSSNKNSSDNIQKTQIISGAPGNLLATNTTSFDNTLNTTSQPEQHKYGRSSNGPTALIRGSQIQNAKPKLSNEHSESADQGAEQIPSVNILVNTESGDAPLTVSFSNLGTAASTVWDFGDGSFSRETSPHHIFAKPGNYIVTLTAKNSAGSVSDKTTIEVRSISAISNNFPNIFTPNGDGENDFFTFETKNITSMSIEIINPKTSEIVYRSSDFSGKWDGKMLNGNDTPEATYLYNLKAIGSDGIPYTRNGFIEIKRIK